MTKEECLKMVEQIKDFIYENCEKDDVYTLHHLENHMHEVEQFVKEI